MSNFSPRSEQITPFYVMAILDRAKQLEADGRDIIHLEIGEPDFPTPEIISEAGIRAIQEGKTKYTPALGLPELRRAIADDYQQRFDVCIDPQRVIVTPGASGALLLLTAIRLASGDQLMMADPGYPCNRNFASLFDAHADLIPCSAEHRYQLTAELIHRHWKKDTVAALVASPSNPTGTQLDPSELADLVDACRQHQGELWVDEIYQGLNFEKPASTVLQQTDDAIVINSFSKLYGMTGWRLGWAVVPTHWLERLDNVAQNIFLAAPTPAQYAALAAFDTRLKPELNRRREELKERRDYLLKALPELGLTIPVTPDGGFYLYIDASQHTADSMKFCQDVLEHTGVALTPGVDFGNNDASHHIRIAYTTPIARLEEAIARLSVYLSD